MTTRVVTVRSDEPITAAVDRMTRYGFSALPVVSTSSRLVGIVSLLDVLRHREGHRADGTAADERLPVEQIMSPDVLTMSATANSAVVARRLREHGELRVLPVVQGGRLVGVVTRGDLLRDRPRTGRPGLLDRLLGGRDRDRDEDDALAALARPRRAGPAPDGGTPVSAVMTRDVVTAGPGDPLTRAAELMLRHRHSALPVVDGDGRLVGVLSEADILADPLAGRSAHATVGSVMTRAAISVDAHATLGEVRSMVADRGLRTVPVVDGDRLVGVLSRSDLV